jgi:hypothetical protein
VFHFVHNDCLKNMSKLLRILKSNVCVLLWSKNIGCEWIGNKKLWK